MKPTALTHTDSLLKGAEPTGFLRALRWVAVVVAVAVVAVAVVALVSVVTIHGCGYISCGSNLRLPEVRSRYLGLDLGPVWGQKGSKAAPPDRTSDSFKLQPP
jgi:hypothetical protein